MKTDLNRCRVCGLYFEDYQPWGEDGTCPQYDICPCCGVEFGNEDFEIFSLRAYRKQWIDNGCKWNNPICRPADWSDLKSLGWLKIMDSRLLLERIVTDLYATPYFAGFKCKKTEFRIYKITNDSTFEIKFACTYSDGCDDIDDAIIVKVIYSIHFDELHKWRNRSCKKLISSPDNSSISFTGNSYTFHFNEQRYSKEFAILYKDVISNAKSMLDRFGTTPIFYQNNVVPIPDNYDFGLPITTTSSSTLHQSLKIAKNMPQLSTAEKENLSNNARLMTAKKYGFKQSNYVNWTVRQGYLFTVFNGTVRVKPLYIDELMREIFKIGNDRHNPISLYSIGIFTANDYVLQTYKEPFVDNYDDSAYINNNGIKLWDDIFRLITQSINTFLRYNPNAETFNITQHRYNNCLSELMMLCHHERYNEALQLIDEEAKAGRSSSVGFSMPDGSHKDAHELIREYCERQLKQQNKDNDHKLLHFLFRRNK